MNGNQINNNMRTNTPVQNRNVGNTTYVSN